LCSFKECLPFPFSLSFLVLLFIHPFLFAIGSAEVRKRGFPFALYCTIEIALSTSIMNTAAVNLCNIGWLAVLHGSGYLDDRKLVKTNAALMASPMRSPDRVCKKPQLSPGPQASEFVRLSP
jgi:hypothetical protein